MRCRDPGSLLLQSKNFLNPDLHVKMLCFGWNWVIISIQHRIHCLDLSATNVFAMSLNCIPAVPNPRGEMANYQIKFPECAVHISFNQRVPEPQAGGWSGAACCLCRLSRTK